MNILIVPKAILILIILSIQYKIIKSDPSCLSITGKEIDWFYILLQNNTDVDNELIYYRYFDSEGSSTKLIEFTSKEAFPPFNFYQSNMKELNTENNYLNFHSSTSKGIFIFNNNSSSILLHSLPEPFPTLNSSISSFSFPYVSHFLCLTLSKQSTLSLADILYFTNIDIIDWFKSKDISYTDDSSIKKLFLNIKSSFPPNEIETNLITRFNEEEFTVFSKTKNTNEDVLDYILMRKFQKNLYVKNRNANGKSPICYKNNFPCVYNVNTVKYWKEMEEIDWNGDEEKWVVIIDGGICFSELDRTTNDENGSVYCFNNMMIYNYLFKSIESFINSEGQIEMNSDY